MCVIDWQVGDVVRLKSGGPKMTVSGETHGDGLTLCYWFDEIGRHYRECFEPEMLNLAVDDEDGFYDANPEEPFEIDHDGFELGPRGK